MRLSDIEQNITKLAVRRFAEARMPTARREIIVTFKPYGPDTIHRLVAVNVLCALEPERIIPRVIAFHLCGWTDSRLQAKSAFEMVVSVLQRMYEITPEGVQPTTEALSSDMERSWPTVDPLVAWRGLYQCHEMGFVSGWAWEKELSEVQPLRINEGIMGIDASHYWGEYIRKESISVESSLQRAYSQKFLHRLSDVTGAREGIGIPPIKWVEIANNLKITQDDRDWIVRHLMTEELITKKPASSDVLALTQKAIVRLQGQRQSFALEEGATLPSTSEPKITERPELLVLISHSSKDHTLASALIDLLRSALGLLPSQIRCSSVDGYRLPGGVHTDTQLRAEVNASRVLIGLITPNSLASPYVLFELGARWGAGEVMIPLLAGVSTEHLRGPLSGLNVLVCSSEEQLHQALAEIGVYVELSLQSPAAYLKHLRSVMEEAQKLLAVNPPSGPTVGTKGIEGKKLRLSGSEQEFVETQ